MAILIACTGLYAFVNVRFRHKDTDLNRRLYGEVYVNSIYEDVLKETKYEKAGFMMRMFGGANTVEWIGKGNCVALCKYFRKELIASGVSSYRIKYVKLYKDGEYVHCMLAVDDIVYELCEVNRESYWCSLDSLLEFRSEFDSYKLR